MPRSKSSSRWLKEHFSDDYVIQAKKAGYRSRAAYKLLEIQEKDHLIKPGMTVVDLGAAPGGWSQVAIKLLKNQGYVFALDILPMDEIAGVDFLQGDFGKIEVANKLQKRLEDKCRGRISCDPSLCDPSLERRLVDVVLSDIAPNVSGIKSVDQANIMNLAENALDFACKTLKPGGSFLTKVFQGEGFDQYLKLMRAHFQKVKTRKPKASRDRSKELYLLGLSFRS